MLKYPSLNSGFTETLVSTFCERGSKRYAGTPEKIQLAWACLARGEKKSRAAALKAFVPLLTVSGRGLGMPLYTAIEPPAPLSSNVLLPHSNPHELLV